MAYQDLIPVLQETGLDYYSARLLYGGVKGRILIPAGAWNIRVNAYAAIDYTVGYVARVNGEPSWDYSGLQGISDDDWNTAPWERDGQGTLSAAATDDWQCRNTGGHALIMASNIAHHQATVVPCWLYMLPIAARGVWSKLEVYFNVDVAGFKGLDWNKANAPVFTYPAGPKFIDGTSAPGPQPDPVTPPLPTWPPIPMPDPEPEPVKPPTVELMPNLDLVIQEVVCRGEVVKGPWTLIFENDYWRLKS